MPSKRPPPGAWVPARRAALHVIRPIERFLHVEASGGILLIVAAVAALAWANSPWAGAYEKLWHTELVLEFGGSRFEQSLHFWINDFLMTIFFLLAGLEIKREIVQGALSDVKRAALPIAAAVGGMLVPALIYASFNYGGPKAHGWGVPMATDIAFAVGVLTLLGTRVHPGLRVLLLAIAIIDDVGAIVVIALFYSTGFSFHGLGLVGAGMFVLWLARKTGVRNSMAVALPMLVIWIGLYEMGIHPTIAGVITGLMSPVRSWFGKEGFLREAESAIEDFRTRTSGEYRDKDLVEPLQRLNIAGREAVSPALRTEIALHPWVAYLIMPLFAFANAGVNVRGIELTSPTFLPVFGGIFLGLFVGKLLGITLASWVSIRLGICRLPPGVTWRGMCVLGAVAGIGFTMAIFISELAFAGTETSGVAKLAVLTASFASAVLAMILGRLSLGHKEHETADFTATEIEESSDYWAGGQRFAAFR